MTRTLTGDIATQAAAASSTPIYYARLDIGGSVGTKWVADRDIGAADGSAWNAAIGCVTAWGTITAQLQEDPRFTPIGDMQLTLNDHDKTWHDWYKAVEFQNKRARIYVSYIGLVEADLTLIFDGIINDTPEWADDLRSFTLNLTDASTRRNKTIGTLADVDTFSGLSEESCDTEIVPIVFGKAKRVPCVPASVAPSCRLAKNCDHADTYIYVDDASRFPQNTPISIRMGDEIAGGSFAGNTFTATVRNANIRTSSVVSAGVNLRSFDDLNLSPNSGTYVGNYIHVTDAGFELGEDWRRISAYDGALRRLFYVVPFIKDSAEWEVPTGTVYDITTRSNNSSVATHLAGTSVRLVQADLIYIVADHACKSVSKVEAFGTTKEFQGQSDNLNFTDTPNFIGLDHDWYTVNLNDTTSFPALGHAVTTITLSKMPQDFIPSLDSNRLWADVDGAETNGDSTGALIENPADIIKELLTRAQWGNIEGAGYNAASFTAAQTRLAYLHPAFGLTKPWELLDLVADLSYQARSALNWNDGVAFLKVLDNESRGSVATLDTNSFEAGSIQRAYTSLREIANEINAVYEDRLDRKQVKVVDTGEQTALGRKVSERHFWAYRAKNEVLNAASFWLHRHKMIYEIVRLKGWLNLLARERVDTVELDYTSLFDAGQFGTIVSVRHSPGGGEGVTAPSIELEIRLPRHAGCSSICEANCETGGCESGCEFACEEQTESCWQCETSCETLCELTGCTTTTEIWCATSDAGCDETGPCGACETSCTTSCEVDSCESSCTAACETDCTASCEASACQAACELAACESSCETGCEGTCQTGCETGCEGTCQTGCEVACEACETGCEGGSCQTGCETGCEGTCQTGCETGCEGTCQTGCESSCESTCETGCETGCETSCETGCETSCETGCETSCETGCETSCETGCELACQTGCEVACQTGCETSCETGCEVECETGAESCADTCETGCEWGCEQECETGAESCASTCETGCETACETGCQAACQTGCQTGCETGGEVSCSFSDDFERSDRALDGDNGWSVYYQAGYEGTVSIVSGIVTITSGDDGYCIRTWPGACGNDVFAQAYVSPGGGGGGPMARHDGVFLTSGHGYLAYVNSTLTRLFTDGWSVLGSGTGGNATYKLECIGTAIKVYRNGGQIISVTDSTVASGAYNGFSIYHLGAIDDYSHGVAT